MPSRASEEAEELVMEVRAAQAAVKDGRSPRERILEATAALMDFIASLEARAGEPVESSELRKSAFHALNAIYLEAPEAVAKDINDRVRAYITSLESRHPHPDRGEVVAEGYLDSERVLGPEDRVWMVASRPHVEDTDPIPVCIVRATLSSEEEAAND